ncbi:hypothetical protein KPC_1600 [Acinetobacter stercoris]|uniref:Uncharacterized protein n=1 Tax=Acinetobacter stercoris TaxID=2126983 RepID=A0A2U3MYA8_9GAMM|nr:hypothetical protein KPC_1600 [Acinetobacter stercoris]
MRTIFRLYIILISTNLFIACQTTDIRPFDLNAYLQRYIGQSSSDIQKHLHFYNLGYQSAQPVLSDNHLIYTIYQPINIPIMINSDPLNPGPIRANSYDVHLKCNVIFNLQQGVAHSISYQGNSC